MEKLDDLALTDIISRIPPNDLHRARSTNKRLRALTSDPYFAKKYARRYISKTVEGLFHICTGYFHNSSFYFPLDVSCVTTHKPHTSLGLILSRANNGREDNIRVIADCNGLVLTNYCGKMFVSNPTTNRCCIIPRPLINIPSPSPSPSPLKLPRTYTYNSRGKSVIVMSGLVVDNQPTILPFNLYKVVSVSQHSYTNAYEFFVYSSETGSWKKCKETIPNGRDSIPSSPCCEGCSTVYLDGTLFWLREIGDILAFNVTEEYARTIQLPFRIQQRGGEYLNTWFGVVEDKITVVSISEDLLTVRVLIDMKDWEIRNCIKTGRAGFERGVPLFFDGEQVVLRFNDHTPGVEMFSYSILTKEWKKITTLGTWLNKCRRFVPYISNELRI